MTKAERNFIARFCEYTVKTGKYRTTMDMTTANIWACKKEQALQLFEHCVGNASKLDGLREILLNH